MKTRSLGIAFAALLAFAPVRGSAQDAASPAAPAKSCRARCRPERSAAERTAALDRAEDRRACRSARRDRGHAAQEAPLCAPALSPLCLLGAVPGVLAELSTPPPQLAAGGLVQLVLRFGPLLIALWPGFARPFAFRLDPALKDHQSPIRLDRRSQRRDRDRQHDNEAQRRDRHVTPEQPAGTLPRVST